MPACLKSWTMNVFVAPSYYSVNLNDTATGGGSTTKGRASVLVPDTTTSDLSKCAAVSLSGAEYQSLTSRIAVLESKPGSSTGGSTVNVTADIFVGAALVCIFVLGWIAGAQR